MQIMLLYLPIVLSIVSLGVFSPEGSYSSILCTEKQSPNFDNF